MHIHMFTKQYTNTGSPEDKQKTALAYLNRF